MANHINASLKISICSLLLFALLTQPANAARKRKKSTQPTSQAGINILKTSQSIVKSISNGKSTKNNLKNANDLLDQTIAYLPESDLSVMRDIVFTQKLASQMDKITPELVNLVLPILEKNPNLAYTLAYQIKPEDKLNDVYTILAKINKQINPKKSQKQKSLDDYANLITAICVVHDQKVVHTVGKHKAVAADPLDIFVFYYKNAKRMKFDIKTMPVDLLIYIVDNAVSINDMQWALSNFKNNKQVGSLFYTIINPNDRIRKKKRNQRRIPKIESNEKWNLPNIQRLGGDTPDQAYFAVAVGKSIGVPTCYITGESSVSEKVWVGYLQSKGKKAYLNTSSGRDTSFIGVKGITTNPQTNKRIAESYVGLSTQLYGLSNTQHQQAAALSHAATQIATYAISGEKWKIESPINSTTVTKTPNSIIRTPSLAHAQNLVIESLKESAGNVQAWGIIQTWSAAGYLNTDDKKKWAKRVNKFCGKKYPDFTLQILTPMIKTVKDIKQQDKLWEAAFKMFARRKDLAGQVRLEQGNMWDKNNNPSKAGKCYYDIVQRYPNAGPFVITALNKVEGVLSNTSNSQAKIIKVYATTWEKIKKPAPSRTVKQSNWYEIGKKYANKLKSAGRSEDAQIVEDDLESIVIKKIFNKNRLTHNTHRTNNNTQKFFHTNKYNNQTKSLP